MWKKNWVWSLIIAFTSSSAMLGLLSYWDENGFNLKKDTPKIIVVLLTVFANYVRTTNGENGDGSGGGESGDEPKE